MESYSAYPQKTAGSNMVSNIPVFNSHETLEYIENSVISDSSGYASLDYIYLTDENHILLGVLSIKNLLKIRDKKIKAEELMDKDMITVDVNTSQEKLVYMALSHGLKSLPVVNDKGVLLGVVDFDAILRIFNHEVQSDVFNFGGIFHRVGDEYTSIHSSAFHMIKSRLPWLIIGVIGGILAASLIAQFEELLASFIALASFIPVMVYMSDAAGTQSEALIIRSLALDTNLSFKSYLWREVQVSLVIGLISGAFAGLLALITRQNIILGLIIFLAMFLSIISSVVIATLSPQIFRKLNFDPAVATGPLATIFSDITTLAIYLAVAMTLLQST
ncbi:MAG: magnesium transporter [Methanobacteriaceae archaeon]|nr:magnesium transporter [Methanobacteriaceae archaeon]